MPAETVNPPPSFPPPSVIPAKAGIQEGWGGGATLHPSWIPLDSRFRGNDGGGYSLPVSELMTAIQKSP